MFVRHFVTTGGDDPFQEWLDRLKDLRGRIAIQRRVDRLTSDNFGDHKSCGHGVWELRIDVGPGYRVYYAMDGRIAVILLCGGDKRSQQADIADATAFWKEYQRRMK